MQIGRKDVLWNYIATFLQIGVGVILLPFILRVFQQETVAIWAIFSMVISFAGMLDFGFNPSFTRNVTYVVSGVKKLTVNGYQIVENTDTEIDYSLFKGLINAMRWFYTRVSLLLFVFLITVGTYYISTVLKTYSGGHNEVYISWAVLCVINSYSLYTIYYDALMQGQGLVMRAKQIQIVGQAAYLIVATIMILLRFNLIAIVSAQALSILIRRILSYNTIYNAGFKNTLKNVEAQPQKEILKSIYPNAVKLGLNGLAAFVVLRSSLIFGSLYLSLDAVASYGITMQIIGIISSIAGVYFYTYLPKISQLRTQNAITSIKNLYLKGCLFSFFTYIAVGLSFIFWGNWALELIKSQTQLLPKTLIIIALFVSFFEIIINLTVNIVLSKNEVPFLKIAFIVSTITFILLFFCFKFTSVGVLGMIIAPGIAECLHWLWMTGAIRELNIKHRDILMSRRFS